MKKSILAGATLASMLCATVTSAFAVDVSASGTVGISTAGSSGQSEVTLIAVDSHDTDWVTGDTFSVIIPAIIPLSMDAEGEIKTPTNAAIKNMNIEKGIEVTGVTVTGQNGWSAADYSSGDFDTEDGKNIGLSINGQGTDGSGTISTDAGTWTCGAGLSGNGQIDLTITAKANKQTTQGNKGTVANISFTVAFDE